MIESLRRRALTVSATVLVVAAVATPMAVRAAATPMAVRAAATPVAVRAAAGPDCFDANAPRSVEEGRLGQALPAGGPAVSTALINGAGFDRLVSAFTTRLCDTGTADAAGRLVAAAGADLWRTAVDRAQGRRPDLGTLDRSDDRPLYWARLEMSRALRQWKPGFAVDRTALLTAFDRAARGLTSMSFPDGPAPHRIFVSGFDPFALDGAGLRLSNPAGAAALRLDGTVLDTPSGRAVVQAVSLPVLWKSFDDGIVEAAFGTVLKDPTRRPDLIMTISQGVGFTIEGWAAGWRGGASDNNDEGVAGPVPPAAGWPRPADTLIRTTLPAQRMIAANTGPDEVVLNELYCVWPAGTTPGTGDSDCRQDGTPPPAPGEVGAMGGGGDFLSNESMFRANRVRIGLGATTVQGGHLHIAPPDGPADPVALTDAAFTAQCHRIVDQTVALVRAAAG